MYDLAIIGAGAGGVACAKAAAASGLKTVLIEKDKVSFGGTCLNKGCIPAKFFLNSLKSNRVGLSGKSWNDSFIEKEALIEKIKAPATAYLQNQGIDIVWGQASFINENSLKAADQTIEAKNIVIAAGSSAKVILNHPKVITDLFSQPKLPNKILIVGAGYVGVELASLLKGLGKDICVVEKEQRILSNFDSSLASRLKAVLNKKGITINTGKDLSGYNLDDFDMVISSVGRVPNTQSLGLENLDIALDKSGWVITDQYMRTNIKNIYACGDIIGKKLLAYTAEYQGRLCVQNIKGGNEKEDYKGVAECVFSIPAAASVGILEEEAKKKNIKYRIIKSNFLKFSSAYVYGDTDGFIEVLIGQEDRIIGAGIISQSAAELISIFSLCIKNNLKSTDLKKSLFIHPTLSEIIPLLLGVE
ncbi:MAG: NAD(P)/FAD-dependent oxidoreductase [Candidatus Omnitrophota bacterium]